MAVTLPGAHAGPGFSGLFLNATFFFFLLFFFIQISPSCQTKTEFHSHPGALLNGTVRL